MIANAAREETSSVAYRHPKHDDLPFVYSGLLESYFHGSPLNVHLRSKDFYTAHRPKLESALSKSSLILACLSDDPAVLIGFALVQPTEDVQLVHYVYVKSAFRRHGVARGLVHTLGISDSSKAVCTHITYDAIKIAAKHKLIFNPYLF